MPGLEKAQWVTFVPQPHRHEDLSSYPQSLCKNQTSGDPSEEGGEEMEGFVKAHRPASLAYTVRKNRRDPASNVGKPRVDTHGCPLLLTGTPAHMGHVVRLLCKNAYLSPSQTVSPFHLPDVAICT